MIKSDKHKFIFIAIPKTGTRSIYQLCENHYDFTRVQEHLNIVPPKYAGYQKFTVVRNPYDRFISMWWSTCIRPDNAGAAGRVKSLVNNSHDPAALLKQMIKRNELGPGNLFSRQCDYLKQTKFDYILYTESLQNDLLSLPFIEKSNSTLGNLNSTKKIWKKNTEARNPDPWEYINQETLELINQYYEEDFVILNQYSKETKV